MKIECAMTDESVSSIINNAKFLEKLSTLYLHGTFLRINK